EVRRGDFGHGPSIKRTFALDGRVERRDYGAIKRTNILFKESAMRSAPPPMARAGLMAVAIVIVQGLLVAWFGWAATHLEPRDVPVVVAAPAPVAEQITARLNAVRAGAFSISTVADEAAADAA